MGEGLASLPSHLEKSQNVCFGWLDDADKSCSWVLPKNISQTFRKLPSDNKDVYFMRHCALIFRK